MNQLLTSLEAHRDQDRLLVMAATNDLEHLDEAVIRPGRFDRHLRIGLPDAAARRAILAAELDDRPVAAEVGRRCAPPGRDAGYRGPACPRRAPYVPFVRIGGPGNRRLPRRRGAQSGADRPASVHRQVYRELRAGHAQVWQWTRNIET